MHGFALHIDPEVGEAVTGKRLSLLREIPAFTESGPVSIYRL